MATDAGYGLVPRLHTVRKVQQEQARVVSHKHREPGAGYMQVGASSVHTREEGDQRLARNLSMRPSKRFCPLITAQRGWRLCHSRTRRVAGPATMFSVARFDSTRVRGARKPKAPAAGTADAAASTPASVLARLNSAAGQRAASTAKRAGSGQSTGATGSNSASRTKKRDRRRTDAGGDAEYPPSAASGRKRPRRARGGDAAQQQQQQQQEAADSGEYGSGEIDGGLAGLPAGTGTHVKFDDAGGASGGGGTGAHRVRRVIDQATQWRSSRKFKGFAGALARKLYGSGDGAIDGTASTSGTAAKPKGAGAGKPPAATTSTDTNAAATAATAAEDSEAWGLAPQLRRVLAGQGVTQFFPIQRMVVPHLLRAQASADPSHCDVCIAAPTGSGKTLSYVLPVVAALQGRTVPRLRALVLVPTRDLVQQVLAVFQAYVAGTDLRVEAAMGHVPFHTESERLRGTGGARGEVCVDILVATPGRLVDHLDDTPGFTLEHLQFLVVDEADRLLSQSYQNWVYRVYAAAPPPAAAGLCRFSWCELTRRARGSRSLLAADTSRHSRPRHGCRALRQTHPLRCSTAARAPFACLSAEVAIFLLRAGWCHASWGTPKRQRPAARSCTVHPAPSASRCAASSARRR